MRITRSVAIALACGVLAAALQAAGAFVTFDLRLLDARFRLRGERTASDAIALVGVDDATIHGYGAWPLPREAYALLITALEDGGARAIGLDLQFPEDANQDPRSNSLLAEVAGAHPNVTQAVWFRADESQPDPQPPSTAAAGAFVRHGIPIGGDAATARGVSLPYDALVANAASLGHISVAVDPDGAIRRLPLVIRYGDRAYPALTLCIAGLANGQERVRAVERTPGGLRVRGMRGRDLVAPTDASGATSIDFSGDRRAFRNTYSMLDVLQWYQAGDHGRIRDAFAGRLILIGLTSRREAAVDMGTTPFAAETPLVYVHANMLDDLLRRRFLSRLPDAAHLGLLVILAAALGGWFAVVSIPAAAILAVLLTLAFAVLDFAMLAVWSIDLPAVAILATPGIVYAATQSYRHLFLERRSRQRDADIRAGLTVQQRFLPEALVGKQLGHYRIDEKIGAGGMGVVYRATDLRLHRDVAVKVLPGGVLADATGRRRFRRQAVILSKLSHPGLAGVYDFDTQDGVDFIVMELVPGHSLAERLRKGRVPEQDAIRIAIDITAALEEAHAHGIVHRDIKPANVMVTPEGSAKLLDFGVARIVFITDAVRTLTNLTREGEMVGTLAYMSPELVNGRPAGPGADIYAIGTLLFEMTTGRRPFNDDVPEEMMWTIVNQNPPSPRVLNARLTPEIEEIILRALQKTPEDRFESATALLAALRRLGSLELENAPGR